MKSRFRQSIALARLDALAQAFRKRYAPGVTGPLELDAIIEFGLKLEIVPLPGLVVGFGKVGWLTSDGRRIVVDVDFQRTQPEDYQSFLAHEAGHFEVHRAFLPRRPFSTCDDFVAFHSGLSASLLAQLEWEAKEMGLRIQMPEDEFNAVFSYFHERAKDQFARIDGPAVTYMEEGIGRHFGVAPVRAGVRMQPRLEQERRLARLERQGRALGLQPPTPTVRPSMEGRRMP